MSDLAEALRRYADAGDPIDLDAVLQRPRRRPPVLRVAAAILVVLAAIATVVTLVRDGEEPTTVTTTPLGPGAPTSFVALTADGELQVRDSRDGAVEHTVATIDHRGPASLAVTPDGGHVYVAQGDGAGGCSEIVRVDLRSGASEPIGAGTDPAISPDGRRLAYVRQNGERCTGTGAQGLVIHDVATGAERTIPAGPEVGRILTSPSWAPGGAEVTFRVAYPDTSSPPVVLRVDAAFSLQDASYVGMDDAHGWFGYLGDTGKVLGVYQQGGDDPKPTALVTLDEVTGKETGRLVATHDPTPVRAASDRTGRHIVYVAGDRAYRWSVGQDEPVAIGDAVSVAWIPRDAPVIPELTASAPLVRGTEVRVRLTGLERLRGHTVELTIWTPGPVETTSGGPRIGYGGLGALDVDDDGTAEGDVLVPNALSGEDDVVPLEPGRQYGLEVTTPPGGGGDRVRLPIEVEALSQGAGYAVTAGRGSPECGGPPIEVDIDGGLWVPEDPSHFPSTTDRFHGTFKVVAADEAVFIAPDGTTSAFIPGTPYHC